MKRKSFPPHPSIFRKEENIYILYYIYIIKRKIYKKKKFSFFRIVPTSIFQEKNKKFFVRVGSLLQPATGGGGREAPPWKLRPGGYTYQQRPLL